MKKEAAIAVALVWDEQNFADQNGKFGMVPIAIGDDVLRVRVTVGFDIVVALSEL
jgi:hypothetical protein